MVLTLDLVQIQICLYPPKPRISEEGSTLCNLDPRKVGPFLDSDKVLEAYNQAKPKLQVG